MKEVTLKQWSVFLYAISFGLPVFIGSWFYIGLICFLLGWIGLFSFEWTMGLPWLANLLYITNLILGKKKLKARIRLSIISIVFGLFAVGITELPRDEGGGNYDVFVGVGFLFWISSFVLMLLDQMKERKNASTIQQ